MKKISLQVFEFDELSPEAQAKAIESLKTEAAAHGSETDWIDANDTIESVEKIVGLHVHVTDSSQGCSYSHITGESQYYPYRESIHEIDKWKMLLWDVYRMKKGTWSDELLFDTFLNYKFESDRGLEANFGNCIVKFCNEVEHQALSYYEDDYVKEYIVMNDFEFLSDGRVYNL